MAKCPRCFAVIPGFSRSCVKCGLHLGNALQWVCPECGNAVRVQDSKCSRCGFDTSKPVEEEQVEELESDIGNGTDDSSADIDNGTPQRDKGIVEKGWKLRTERFGQKGVLTWGDSIKIGCGVAMAPYIFAIISLVLYVAAAIVLLIFNTFYQEGLGFLVDSFESFQTLFDQAGQEQKR